MKGIGQTTLLWFTACIAVAASGCERANPAYDPGRSAGVGPPFSSHADGGRLEAAADAPRVAGDLDASGDGLREGADVDVDPLAVGLVGYWPLDEAGDRLGADQSGRGNDGELRPEPRTDALDPAGKVAGAFAPRGQSWLRVPDSDALDEISSALTLAAWIYLDSSPAGIVAIGARQFNATVDEHYGLFLNGTSTFAYVGVDGSGFASPRVTLKRWTHLALTFDGRNIRIYVDGVDGGVRATARKTPSADTTPFTIGGNVDTSADKAQFLFPGLIDEVRLYQRALSADEVAGLAAGLPR